MLAFFQLDCTVPFFNKKQRDASRYEYFYQFFLHRQSLNEKVVEYFYRLKKLSIREHNCVYIKHIFDLDKVFLVPLPALSEMEVKSHENEYSENENEIAKKLRMMSNKDNIGRGNIIFKNYKNKFKNLGQRLNESNNVVIYKQFLKLLHDRGLTTEAFI
jgi:hypothetical protein